jgi:hypothetical protein
MRVKVLNYRVQRVASRDDVTLVFALTYVWLYVSIAVQVAKVAGGAPRAAAAVKRTPTNRSHPRLLMFDFPQQ